MYPGLPIECTGTDKTWAKMHASTLIKHITENPSKIWRPVRSENMKKSITNDLRSHFGNKRKCFHGCRFFPLFLAKDNIITV